MQQLGVGGFYGTPQVRPEGMQVIGLNADRMEVLVVYAGLTEEDVAKWQAGPIEVGIAEVGGLAILLRNDPLGQGDAPYDIRAGLPGERTIPSAQGYSPVLWVLLEAETGRIRALKWATVTPTFMRVLRPILAKQLQGGFEVTRYMRQVDAYQQQSVAQLWAQALVREQLALTEPVLPAGPPVVTADQLQATYPQMDRRVAEVLEETLSSGVAHIEQRDGEDWYIDPEYGEDIPVTKLGYDDTLGMVDRRRFPEHGKA